MRQSGLLFLNKIEHWKQFYYQRLKIFTISIDWWENIKWETKPESKPEKGSREEMDIQMCFSIMLLESTICSRSMFYT